MFNRYLFSGKRLGLLAALTLVNAAVMAQQPGGGTGQGALQSAATTVRGYGTATQQLILAIGLIIGFVGAIRVYGKWHNGDPDTQKAAIGWFGACLFLVGVSTVLTSFFGG